MNRPVFSFFSDARHQLLASGLVLSALLTSPASHAQTLYNTAGATLSMYGDQYNFGSFENAGSFTPGTGRFILDSGDFLVTGAGTIGAGTATVELTDGSTPRVVSLRNQALPTLRLNVPQGTSLASSGIVSTALVFTAGHLLTTNANTLTLASDAVLIGEANANYVKGRVRQTKSLVGSTPVDFGQMGFTVNPSAQSFPLTVERRAGLLLPGVSFGQNPSFAAFQSIDRVWALSSPSIVTVPVTIVLSWLSDNDHGLVFAGNNAQVWRSDNGGASWVRQNAVADGSGRSMSISTTQLNALYTVSTTSAPLPVELMTFTGTRMGDDGLLRWRTASEKNSAYFEVQQSTDGRSFVPLGRVSAAGSSASPREYAHTDQRISRYGAALVYYRLRQVDLDGTTAFSPVITLAPVRVKNLTLDVWPNPLTASSQLLLAAPGAGDVSLTVYDAAGRLLYQRAVPAATTLLDLPSVTWPSGSYVLMVRQGQTLAVRRLVRE